MQSTKVTRAYRQPSVSVPSTGGQAANRRRTNNIENIRRLKERRQANPQLYAVTTSASATTTSVATISINAPVRGFLADIDALDRKDTVSIERSIVRAVLEGRLPVEDVPLEPMRKDCRGILMLYSRFKCLTPGLIKKHVDADDVSYFMTEYNIIRNADIISADACRSVIRHCEAVTEVNNAAETIDDALQECDPVRAIAIMRREADRLARFQTCEDGPEVIDAADWLVTPPGPIEPVIDGLIGLGDKLAIIGPSKARKSFFALQAAISIATGQPFLRWATTPRRVLLVQFEVREAHYHRRVRHVCEAMLATMPQGQLQIINGRGKRLTVDDIWHQAKRHGAEVVFIDPLYKLMTGEENNQRDMADMLAQFDRVAEDVGAAVIYVHHDAKGRAGDRDTRDRGSGSGVLSRDYDSAIALTPHAEDDTAAVIEPLLRNHPPQDAFSARWDGCFRVADDLLATPETSRTASAKRARGPALDDLCAKAKIIMGSDTYRMGELRTLLHEKLGVGERRVREVIASLTTAGTISTEQEHVRGGGILVRVKGAQRDD